MQVSLKRMQYILFVHYFEKRVVFLAQKKTTQTEPPPPENRKFGLAVQEIKKNWFPPQPTQKNEIILIFSSERSLLRFFFFDEGFLHADMWKQTQRSPEEEIDRHAIQPAAMRTCLKTHYIGTLSKIVIYMEITRAWGVPSPEKRERWREREREKEKEREREEEEEEEEEKEEKERKRGRGTGRRRETGRGRGTEREGERGRRRGRGRGRGRWTQDQLWKKCCNCEPWEQTY